MEQYLPPGVTIEDVIAALAAMSAFLVVLAIWSSGIIKDPMHGRVKHLQERRSDLKRGYTAPTKRKPTVGKASYLGTMQKIVNKFSLLKNEQADKFRLKLLQGGYRSNDALVYFMFFKLILPVLIGVIAIVLIYGMGMWNLEPMMKTLVTGGAVLLSSIMPEIVLKNQTTKRNVMMQRSLPDMLDLLVICAEAGLTLDSALQRVVREMAQTGPELADELGYTAIELGFLPNRRQALDNLAERVTLPAVRSVTATLIQSEKYGTPLAQSLRVLSAEFRNERMMKAEEKAAKLPATMTIPLILFILPTLFVVLIGPAACQISATIA